MGLDYKTVKACYDAQALLVKEGRIEPGKIGDRTYELNLGYYRGAGKISYSQQEITIYPSNLYRDYDCDNVIRMYPERVGRTFFSNPWKEYIYFYDRDGILRYYLTHHKGLRIQRDGDGYKAINPVQDYRIEVDRVKAKKAREPVEELYNYIASLWDMIEAPDNYNDRPWSVPAILPSMDEREAWHGYLLACKYARRGSMSRETAMTKMRQHFTAESLAYKVTAVPDTRTDHTGHWARLYDIRKAGMLSRWENKNGTKKKKAA